MASREAKGLPPPDWYLECPEIEPQDEWFIGTFWELSTERQLGFGAPGPIPVSAIRRYALEHEFDQDVTDFLVLVIRTMDEKHHEWVASQKRDGGG